MINQQLHRQPVGLDSQKHRNTRFKPHNDWSFATKLNSVFLAATEFSDAARDFPIVFINGGKDESGKVIYAPIAVLGMAADENLIIDDKNGWKARYVPALIRSYPFATARLDQERFAILMDGASGGVNESEGERLFDDAGQATAFTQNVQKQLEALEGEIQRTRLVCEKLSEMDLLREMRFDAEFPGGRKHTVDGFLAVDQGRVGALTDAQVMELHKLGLLGLIHAHWVSLGNMRHLADWYVQKHPEMSAPATAAA